MGHKAAIMFFTVVFYLMVLTIAKAGNLIAALQYSYPNGLTTLVFQTGVEDETHCRQLNETHWKGVKTSDPKWTKDYAGCLTSMPNGYEPILDNEPIIFPYISVKQDRIIIYGVPMNEAIRICKEKAEVLRRHNLPAICIVPNR